LTLIVGFLLAGIVAGNQYGILGAQYVGLFPLVILTHLVERFWTVEAEDGTAASFKTLLGTLVVALTVSLALSPRAVTTWMFLHPETLGVALAGQFLLGRYTGYRVVELFRFRDLVEEFPPAAPPPAAAGARSGDRARLARQRAATAQGQKLPGGTR
jgi:hypothetical protein